VELEIKDLHISAEEKEIVKGVSLKIRKGELHVVMGPNGSGKTTLAKAIMGQPDLKATGGDILVDGKSILGMKVDERAKLGIFLQFQNPVEVEGLGFMSFLNAAKGSIYGDRLSFKDFMAEVKNSVSSLSIKEDLIGRSLNFGFSGGEKKKIEILQMAILKPKVAILDEPDSGLDIDAVRVVAEGINQLRSKNEMGILLITHYSRILNYMEPQFIHVMKDGVIIKEGGKELITEVEEKGYNA
jgi:Fe-S cluster assembly ATP-binding protein